MEALLKVLESFKTDIEKKIDGVGERIDSLSEDLGGRMQEAEQRLGKHVSRGRAGWMDKSWMLADRRSLRFQTGFENFLQFASANAADKSSIRYPCLKCCNHHEFTIGVIKGHVYFNGFMTNYRKWSLHGETSAREGNSDEESKSVDMPEVEDGDESEGEEMSCDSDEFFMLVEDGDKALYQGCTKSTKLNALVEMFNLKAKHGMTDSCYSDWLMLFGSLLLDGNEVPNNLNQGRKFR
ncbi:PREDICTED: uncharacterized protein LOC101299058 [Fragaria vesca subsp. vesca]